MADHNQFKLPVDDVLGVNYGLYCDKIKALAVSQPSQYFDLRRQVLIKCKKDALGALYGTLFALLTEGKTKDGAPIGLLGTGDYLPGYPSPKANDFCLSACSELNEWCTKCVDILLPADFEKISSAGLRLKGKSQSIDIAAPGNA